MSSRPCCSCLGGAARVGQQQLHVGEGRHERVVDLVVQRDGHLADRREPLGANQVLLRLGQRFAQLAAPPYPLQNLGQQLGQRRVLGQVVVGAPAQRGGHQRLVAMAGHQHDGRRRPAGCEWRRARRGRWCREAAGRAARYRCRRARRAPRGRSPPGAPARSHRGCRTCCTSRPRSGSSSTSRTRGRRGLSHAPAPVPGGSLPGRTFPIRSCRARRPTAPAAASTA